MTSHGMVVHGQVIGSDMHGILDLGIHACRTTNLAVVFGGYRRAENVDQFESLRRRSGSTCAG